MFGGVIVDGKFNEHGIVGKRIAYRLGENDILMADSIKLPRERKVQPSGPGTHTRGGFLPPDHPLFSIGPIVAGHEILKPQDNGTANVIMIGSLPPDHPIYSRGPMIFGRPDPPKKEPEKK